MKRMSLKSDKDKKIFIRTAKKTKAINVKPVVMRGGFHL